MNNIAEDHSQQTRALFALAVVCFFWGTTWVASKEAVRHMPALQMAGLRQFIGGACFVLFFIARGTTWPRGQEWRNILVLSVLNFMLSNGLSTWGVKYISAGLGAIIGAIFPLWLLIIGLFTNKSKLKPQAIIGLVVGFAGVCFIFTEHLHDLLNPLFRFGILISVISTWTWAFGTLYTKKHAATFNPYFSLGLQMVISGMALFSIAHATGNAVALSAIPWQSWAAIAFLTVFSSIITFIAFIYALQHLPVEQVSLYAYVNPIVAVILGWLLFDEKLTFLIVGGVLVTLYGVFLVNRSK
jgi:drug/metabolite transporter (DMT)-like permease